MIYCCTDVKVVESFQEGSEVKSLNGVQFFVTPWTVAHQAPPPTEFSRQEYWSGLPFPSPGDLPYPGIKPRSPALQADALPSEPPGKHFQEGRSGQIWQILQGGDARGDMTMPMTFSAKKALVAWCGHFYWDDRDRSWSGLSREGVMSYSELPWP